MKTTLSPTASSTGHAGGAVGSALASALYTHFGWSGIVAVGSGLGLVSLVALVLASRR
ncbi:MAG: hypothetical protein ACREYA_31210 [Cupriavidus necator]